MNHQTQIKAAVMPMNGKKTTLICAACGQPSEGNRAIHRDGFGEGPEVWLCNACGMLPVPTLASLWQDIAKRKAAGLPMSYLEEP